MDPSALIFVALAVAWGAYLLPTAIRHRDEVQRGRSVERFSHRMRVLARRVPTSSSEATLVVTPTRTSRPAAEPVAESEPIAEPVSKPVAPTKAQVAARRRAAAVAARRRRNVLSLILFSLVVVSGLALGGLFSPWWIAAPAGVLLAWLVACRLTVKAERRTDDRLLGPTPTRTTEVDPADVDTEFMPVVDADLAADTEAIAVDDDPSRWDMVPVTLPTYVSKPAAERSVQTIDLESTGVWTSGRTEIDAEIARVDAEERKATKDAEQQSERRATGT